MTILMPDCKHIWHHHRHHHRRHRQHHLVTRFPTCTHIHAHIHILIDLIHIFLTILFLLLLLLLLLHHYHVGLPPSLEKHGSKGRSRGGGPTIPTMLPFDLMMREMVFHIQQQKYNKEKEAEKTQNKKKEKTAGAIATASTNNNPLIESRDLHCYSPVSCLSRTPALVRYKYVTYTIHIPFFHTYTIHTPFFHASVSHTPSYTLIFPLKWPPIPHSHFKPF